MDSVKSTVTVLEGGRFNWWGCFSVGGYQFVEEEVYFNLRRVHLVWRRSYFQLEGAFQLEDTRGGSTSTVGGVHFIWREV